MSPLHHHCERLECRQGPETMSEPFASPKDNSPPVTGLELEAHEI